MGCFNDSKGAVFFRGQQREDCYTEHLEYLVMNWGAGGETRKKTLSVPQVSSSMLVSWSKRQTWRLSGATMGVLKRDQAITSLTNDHQTEMGLISTCRKSYSENCRPKGRVPRVSPLSFIHTHTHNTRI